MGNVWSFMFGPAEPRRDVSSKYMEHLEFVKSYIPRNHEVKYLRILLHGPVGAGKSSFINSVDTILQNRVAGRAQTDAYCKTSFTRKLQIILEPVGFNFFELCTHFSYKTFKFRKEQDRTYSFVFNDIMGLEKDSDCGVPVGDIKLALRGHMEEGYEFNSDRGLTEGDLGYNSYPTVADKVHVLVCVVPVSSVSTLEKETVAKLREVRLAARDLGIPQMAILTKVDAVKLPNNTDESKYLQKQVEDFHMLLGIPLNCIFLVQNYTKEREMNKGMNKAIVCALRQMVEFGEDYLNDL